MQNVTKYKLPNLILKEKNKLNDENKFIKHNLLLNINRNYLNYIFSIDLDTLLLYMDWTNLDMITFLDIINNNNKKNFLGNIANIYIINEFFEQLYIAEAFIIFNKLYFEIKIDERGRQYKVGYPLNFISNKFIRPLFNFELYEELNLNKKIQTLNIYLNCLSDLVKKDKKKENYIIYNILKNPLTGLIGLDAVTQIYQLQATQIVDLDLLRITKVIKGDEDDDLYIILNPHEINKNVKICLGIA